MFLFASNFIMSKRSYIPNDIVRKDVSEQECSNTDEWVKIHFHLFRGRHLNFNEIFN